MQRYNLVALAQVLNCIKAIAHVPGKGRWPGSIPVFEPGRWMTPDLIDAVTSLAPDAVHIIVMPVFGMMGYYKVFSGPASFRACHTPITKLFVQ